MRIFLDGRMFYHSGIGRYGRNLYRELLSLPSAPEIVLGLNPAVKRRLEKKTDYLPFNASIYSFSEQILGGYTGWRYRRRFDLFHFPHYNIPWFFPGKMVVTCHDLIHLIFPQYFASYKVAVARGLLGRVARQAETIIAVSKQSRQDFLSFFPEARGKTEVIYQGVGEEFRPSGKEEIDNFKREHDLGDFLLYVGNCKPHKNLPRLIAAYAQVKKRFPGLKLVILSQDGDQSKVREAISRWKVMKEVKLLKLADQPELIRYYNAAALLVFPSLYEGFGLPPLEAMACGTPVVASNTSSIPEVVGGDAVLIEPAETDSISSGIERVLTDTSLRKKLRAAGLKRAHRFSWEETARQTFQVYQRIID
ncbi:MAG: glycosyltransferase family 4 protein [bacterium]